MTTINPYLMFDGNCEEAFNFYKTVFGGEFAHVGRFSEMPESPNCPPVAEDEKNLIMHVSLPISKETVLMGSDTSKSYGPPFALGNNFSISINAQSNDQVDDIFNKLKVDGTVVMPLDITFWGSYFGMLTDKFGIQWMVSCETSEHK